MEKNKENKQTNSSVDDIEVVIGDDSVLEISEVGDCMNDLRPKDFEKNKKEIIIPKSKKQENKEDENK